MSTVRGYSVIQGKMNINEIKLNYGVRGCIPPKKKHLRSRWNAHPIYYIQTELTVE